MKMKKLTALLLAGMMAVSMTACGGTAEPSEPAQTNEAEAPQAEAADAAEEPAAEETSASGEKVKLKFYDWSDEQAYLDPLVEAYNAQSDVAEVEVEYFAPTEYAEKILASFASGVEFDVLGVNGVSFYGEYQNRNVLQELTQYVEADKLDTSVYGNVFTQSNPNGIFGLPYRQSVWLLFVNEELFTKAGLSIPTEQLTWDEYRELAKQLTKDGAYGGLVGMDNYVLMQQLGGSVLDEDVSVIKQNLELWKALHEDGSHVPFEEKLEMGQNAGSMFTTAPADKVAMFMNGTWGVTSYNGKYESGEMPFKYRVMPMPVMEGTNDYTAPCGMNFLSVSKTSKHPEEAYDFIKFACTYEGANIIAGTGTLTAYSDEKVKATYEAAVQQEDDTLSKIVFSENNAIEQIYDPNYSAVETILTEEMELYMIGEQDIDTTMDNFVKRRAEIIG